MLFLPYSTETVLTRWPVANLAIVGLTSAVSLVAMAGGLPEGVIEQMVLDGWHPAGLLGYLFLHADLKHLFFNMWALWVFWNAACETTGSLRYAAMYLGTGLLAAVIHNLFDARGAIGASGAISGIIGFYLVLFPTNRVSCFYWVVIRAGVTEVTGYWLVAFWFVGDAIGAARGAEDGIAYWAHLGGLLAGLALGVLYAVRGWARLQDYDNPSLVDLLFRRRSAPSVLVPHRSRDEWIAAHRREEAAKAEAAVDAACPHCRAGLRIPVAAIGGTITCPACGRLITVEE